MISKWRLIKPVEINQYDITMATHYDITMGNDVARDVHCEITMSNDIARDIHCDITMSNDVVMCTYHDITMPNEVAMNLFYYVFSALYLIMILLWIVCDKNKNKFMFDQSGLENTFIVFCVGLFHSEGLMKYPYTNSSFVLLRLIKYSLVLVILTYTLYISKKLHANIIDCVYTRGTC